jgi:protein O-GlcNAc transferase
VLTLEGRTFAARVGASLLKGIGMDELICRSPAEYEQAALAIATSPQRAAELKQRLAGHRTTYPLFDTAGFARSLESAFATMHERHRQGLAPDHLRVAGPGHVNPA